MPKLPRQKPWLDCFRWMRESGEGQAAAARHFKVRPGTVRQWVNRYWAALYPHEDPPSAPINGETLPPSVKATRVYGPKEDQETSGPPPGYKTITVPETRAAVRKYGITAEPSPGVVVFSRQKQTSKRPQFVRHPDKRAVLLKGLDLGMSLQEAADLAGFILDTLQGWMRRGDAARKLRDAVELGSSFDPEGARITEMPEEEISYLDLREAMITAQARATQHHLMVLRVAGQPVQVAGVNRDGKPVLDDNGTPIKRVTQKGEYRASLEWLRAKSPDFQRPSRQVVSHTGPDGEGPIKTDIGEALRATLQDIFTGMDLDKLRKAREQVAEIASEVGVIPEGDDGSE